MDKLLNQLKHLQVKPKVVKCTASSTCWCSKISYKHQHTTDTCMSPAEMLEACGKEMGSADVKYLKTLSQYEFDRNEP